MMPSIRNMTQCSWIALATARPMLSACVGFIVMIVSLEV